MSAVDFNSLPNELIGYIAELSGEKANLALGCVSKRIRSIVGDSVWKKVNKAHDLIKKNPVKILTVHTENWKARWNNIKFIPDMSKYVEPLRLQITDIPSSSKFQSLVKLYARNASVHLLFVQSQNDFDELAERHKNLENTPNFVIVAKKNNVSIKTTSLKPDKVLEFHDDASADDIFDKIGLYFKELIQMKPVEAEEPKLFSNTNPKWGAKKAPAIKDASQRCSMM